MAFEYEAFAKGIPKVELHCHLGGSARSAGLVKQLTSKGHTDAEKLAARCFIKNGIDTERTPSEQNEMFEIVSSAYSSPADKKQLTIECIEQFAQDNVMYLELRTGLSERDKYASVLHAIDQHQQQMSNGPPPIVRLISSIHRDWNFKRAEQAMKLAFEHRSRGVVALDLCGDPKTGQFKPFAPLFEYAVREGMPWTCHFAESDNETDLVDILNARPSRLGHCCYIANQPEIEERIRRERIPIECCLSSNINTMRLHRGVQDHPVRRWIEQKQPFVLCTDNPGILCTSVSREYALLGQELNLSQETLLELAQSSIDYTFADDAVKQSLHSRFAAKKRTTHD